MTDEKRPIRQISINLQEFQAATSDLTDVTVKAVIYEAFVESTRMWPSPPWQGFHVSAARNQFVLDIHTRQAYVLSHQRAGFAGGATDSQFRL